MIDNVKKVLAGFAALAALALGGSAIAGATGDGSGSGPDAATEQVAEEENEGRDGKNEAAGREGKKDAAAQEAACEAAGVDPSAENIEFDDETGTCALDSGEGNNESGEEGEEE